MKIMKTCISTFIFILFISCNNKASNTSSASDSATSSSFSKTKNDCDIEVKCKYGIGNVCRFNILIDGEKYSKVFNCTETNDFVKQDAEDACKAGAIDISWEKGWRDECK